MMRWFRKRRPSAEELPMVVLYESFIPNEMFMTGRDFDVMVAMMPFGLFGPSFDRRGYLASVGVREIYPER
jgi:hypothetical protein